jgi:hypothetical protein
MEIESVEATGRFLSSLGFVIFILSNISFKKTIVKVIAFPLLVLISFALFYQCQGLIIDNIGKGFTPKEKNDMLLLSSDKDLLYFKELDYPLLFNNEDVSQSQVFLSMYPYLRSEDKPHLSALNLIKTDIVTASNRSKYAQNEEHLEVLLKQDILKLIRFHEYYKLVHRDQTRVSIFNSSAYIYLYKMTVGGYKTNYLLLKDTNKRLNKNH